VWHVFGEEGERHLGVEGVDGGGEGLTAPDGGDEGFACERGEIRGGKAREGGGKEERRRTVEELLVELGEFSERVNELSKGGRKDKMLNRKKGEEKYALIRFLRIRHQQLVHNSVTQQLTHYMPQQALHDDPQPGIIETHLAQSHEERRSRNVVDVGEEGFSKRDEGAERRWEERVSAAQRLMRRSREEEEFLMVNCERRR
jgi:hypothetical protein